MKKTRNSNTQKFKAIALLFCFVFLTFSSSLIAFSKGKVKPPQLIQGIFGPYETVVYGNELPAVAAAVMNARRLKDGSKVLLVRRNKINEPFGGLLVQGGLSYLDRNQIDSSLTPSSEFYAEFLKKAKVKVVAADPILVDETIRTMLTEEKIHVLHDATLEPMVRNGGLKFVKIKESGNLIEAKKFIDASQNADIARAAGLKYSLGFEGLGLPQSTLPVTPVFTTKGINVQDLQAIEKRILNDEVLLNKIREKIRFDLSQTVDGIPPNPAFAEWLLKNLETPMYVGADYIDVRSIALGAAYHLYRNKPYNFKKGFLFDRPNIAILKNGEMSWNSMLFKFSSDEVLKMADKGSKLTSEMYQELFETERWLRTFPEGKNLQLIPPQELYIRQVLNITDVEEPLDGAKLIEGGVEPVKAVGKFSYPMDVRGGVDGLQGKFPKATFNFGTGHCKTKIEGLYVVGRSAGYTGLGPAVGRILELNVSVASFL
jgi:hypothetical protein